jgi:ubiquitin fusion degradation protein 1
MFPDMIASRPFKTAYRAYSVSMLPGNERADVERGGKSECQKLKTCLISSLNFDMYILYICHYNYIFISVIMPPSALEQLSRQRIVYPMLFKLSSESTGRTTHCGVLEFVADEGKVYLPNWVSFFSYSIIVLYKIG